MATMLKKDILAIIQKHTHWLNQDVNGWEKMRADLSEQDLSKFDLKGVNLSGAILVRTRFNECNLISANFSGAYMNNAIFVRADMHSACLDGAQLNGANLEGANLSFSSFNWADLTYACCARADISYGDLRYAKLDECCMDSATLNETQLSDKDRIRKGVILKNPMIGYKKTKENAILKAEIPAGAIVYSINGSKCRTNRATILSTGRYKVLTSTIGDNVTYRKGQEIVIDDFDLAYNRECTSGFHFFRTKKEAIAY